MGCNFYTLDGQHIGKRSAAGFYCWDCDATLCKGGESRVHYSDESGWYDNCPVCGNIPIKEEFSESSAGRELGFNKQPFAAKSGIKSCSSFRWALDASKIAARRFVVDEYGKRYTIAEFQKMLEECPIRYYDSIGQEFC